ncbi:hypothetical protein CDD81_5955 [Ophiocordyceps australis]|uniref:Major facilitator superfamily (MFS) profile domain-containing protein n=1 Tax=Ophiocordyceps australis TaxID=1399860 RepID=A0A2C5YGU4_9HYPO|nr:hypothetical protein CDD81_5955 [Ophiocordyceps australis]
MGLVDVESSSTSSSNSQTQAQQHGQDVDNNYRPKSLGFWLILASALVSMFLVALDRTIVATAIPRITDDFGSLGDVGWYGSAYMLTTAAFQLVFGRLYRFYDLRTIFLCSIVVFTAGSAICASAPNSPVFILGRAISGLGSAGIMTGSTMIIIPMVPLPKRPMFQSLFGILFGIASVTGPLIGGAFTQHATWRWCFYMNLPIGAVAFVWLFIFLRLPTSPSKPATAKEHILRLDPLGTLFFVPAIVCLVLALQWGGSTYNWGNWRIIVLFVVFALALIAFCAVQYLLPDTATLPVRIIKQRTMLSAALAMFFLSGSMMICIYYIPLWFQTTHGVDPVKSGIYTIPLVVSLVMASLMSAAVTQRIGHYAPSMLLSPCVSAIGQGIMTTWTPTTASPQWIGFQFLVGFGLGLGMQAGNLAVQAALAPADVSTGISINFFAQQLGGAVSLSVGQTILSGLLVHRLAHALPGLDAQAIVRTGATEMRRIVPAALAGEVVGAYNYALTRVFFAGLAFAMAQLLSASFVEWRNIKKQRPVQAKA